MYFLQVISFLFLLALIDGFAEASPAQWKDIMVKTSELKKEVDSVLKVHRENCDNTGQLDDFEKFVADFLTHNSTTRQEVVIRQPTYHLKLSTTMKPEVTTESFMTKMKHKIVNLFGHNKTESHPETKLKRCLTTNLPRGSEDSGFDGAEVTIEKETFNVTSPEAAQEFRRFLLNFIDCLEKEKVQVDVMDVVAAKHDENRIKSTTTKPSTTIPPTAAEALTTSTGALDYHDKIFQATAPPTSQNISKTDCLLRYLAHVKHSVQDTGRPNFKPPDLVQVQKIVDKIKSVDFLNLDEEQVTSPCPLADDVPLPVAEASVLKKRNVFGVKESHHRGLKKTRVARAKLNRKPNDLFRDMNLIPFKNQLVQEVQDVQEEEQLDQVQVAEPSESQKLMSDLGGFQSKLSGNQRMEIDEFLDHINDKPKPFVFDASPYMQSEMEKSSHPSLDASEKENDEEATGAGKFFDFSETPVKRSIDRNQGSDFQMIAKLKSKLIAEYRQHHPIIDYASILRDVEAKEQHKEEKGDDFVNSNYQLNDGSSRVNDFLKPYRTDKRVMSPYELSLNLQLDNEFKDLDFHDRKEPKTDSLDFDAPLFKREADIDRELDDFSP